MDKENAVHVTIMGISHKDGWSLAIGRNVSRTGGFYFK